MLFYYLWWMYLFVCAICLIILCLINCKSIESCSFQNTIFTKSKIWLRNLVDKYIVCTNWNISTAIIIIVTVKVSFTKSGTTYSKYTFSTHYILKTVEIFTSYFEIRHCDAIIIRHHKHCRGFLIWKAYHPFLLHVVCTLQGVHSNFSDLFHKSILFSAAFHGSGPLRETKCVCVDNFANIEKQT